MPKNRLISVDMAVATSPGRPRNQVVWTQTINNHLKALHFHTNNVSLSKNPKNTAKKTAKRPILECTPTADPMRDYCVIGFADSAAPALTVRCASN